MFKRDICSTYKVPKREREHWWSMHTKQIENNAACFIPKPEESYAKIWITSLQPKKKKISPPMRYSRPTPHCTLNAIFVSLPHSLFDCKDYSINFYNDPFESVPLVFELIFQEPFLRWFLNVILKSKTLSTCTEKRN